jgi:hypothetical protein
MPNSLGPLDVNCDAPPYNIVRACQMIGIRSPADVRWSRLSRFINTRAGRAASLKHSPWRTLFGIAQPDNANCLCGQKLPLLERYTFTLISGNQASYLLGQCPRCLTVYWEEA